MQRFSSLTNEKKPVYGWHDSELVPLDNEKKQVYEEEPLH